MHKKVLSLIIVLIGLSVAGYFVYFSLPLNIPLDIEEVRLAPTESLATQSTSTPPTPPDQSSLSTTTAQLSATSTAPTQAPTSIPDQATTTIPVQTNTITVSYTNTGFTPTNIEVKKGTTIVFTNNSTRAVWVASDNHPTHDLLPEFDQGGISRPGETYEYTFDKVGSWPYHNHLIPSQKGNIKVNN